MTNERPFCACFLSFLPAGSGERRKSRFLRYSSRAMAWSASVTLGLNRSGALAVARRALPGGERRHPGRPSDRRLRRLARLLDAALEEQYEIDHLAFRRLA